MPDNQQRAGILGQVRNPLVFFALALLIIEGIIGFVVTKSQMSGTQQFYAVCIMAGLFLVVVITVALITIRWPSHLYEQMGELRDAITSTGFEEAIEEAIEEALQARIKPECLVEPQAPQLDQQTEEH